MQDDSAGKSDWLSKLKQFGPTGLLALLWTVAPAVAGFVLLAHIGAVSDWLLERPSTGLAIYVLVFITAGGGGLLPTYSQAIVGGWVFGIAAGIPAALIGFTGAAVLGYVIARTVSQDKVEQRINANARARVIRNALVGHGPWRTFFIVALLRLPPNSPFALTNLAMASTGVARLPYIAGTMIGMFPRTAVAVVFASMASENARDIQELLSEARNLPMVIAGLVVMFIVLGIIGTIANHALNRLDVAKGEEPDDA